MLGIEGEYPPGHPKRKNLTVVSKNCQKSAEKYFGKNSVSHNSVNLSTIVCAKTKVHS